MKSEELFVGFSPEVQAKHEQYLVDRFGEGMKQGLGKSKARVQNWNKADWQKSGVAFNAICHELAVTLEKKAGAESREVQAIIRRHYEWLKQFWTPTRDAYAGHAQLIVDSELRRPYELHHPQLPEFAAAAMKVFAENELA